MSLGADGVGSEATPAERFPALFGLVKHGQVRCRFELTKALPPDDRIGNVNVVPFVDECVVILHLANGEVDVPGGTREPGERYLDAIHRELREEAGADLCSFTPFGCWRCVSSAVVPYRPHLPHPHYCRLVGYGEVTVNGQPTNPPGGEQVVAVEIVSVGEAAARFRAVERPDLADLYGLAAELRASASERRARSDAELEKA